MEPFQLDTFSSFQIFIETFICVQRTMLYVGLKENKILFIRREYSELNIESLFLWLSYLIESFYVLLSSAVSITYKWYTWWTYNKYGKNKLLPLTLSNNRTY